jgi:hypothetical protein
MSNEHAKFQCAVNIVTIPRSYHISKLRGFALPFHIQEATDSILDLGCSMVILTGVFKFLSALQENTDTVVSLKYSRQN